MHPKQLAFFADPARSKSLLGGRQGGKTWGTGLWLCADWKKFPGGTSVYITKTAKSAAHRVWPQIKVICERFGIRVKFNNSDLIATFPNGYKVWCTGCKDKNEADKIRGESFGFQKIAIDEPATFPDELISYICTEVAEWTLLQTRGDMLLCGTPGPIPAGFWHDICHNEAWGQHKFTALDNPFLPDPQGALDEFCRKYGYTYASPKVRREFFAEWALDTESLVYLTDLQTFIEYNGYWELPISRPPDLTTLGVDLGYDPDPCAFVIASSWRERREIYIQRAYTKGKLTPDLIAGEIRQLRNKYGVHRVIVDAGGGGLTTAQALQKSYGVAVEATPKGVKRPKIDLMRGAINSRVLKVHLRHAQELVSDYKTILWNDDRDNHHELCDDHNADAAIQAALPHAQFALDFSPAPEVGSGLSAEKLAAFEKAAQHFDDAEVN